jgi:hypothetical protein
MLLQLAPVEVLLLFKLVESNGMCFENVYSRLKFSFFLSIAMQKIKRTCSIGSSRLRCSTASDFVVRKTKKRRSVAPNSTTDVLNDENWGVSITTLLIITKKFSICFCL